MKKTMQSMKQFLRSCTIAMLLFAAWLLAFVSDSARAGAGASTNVGLQMPQTSQNLDVSKLPFFTLATLNTTTSSLSTIPWRYFAGDEPSNHELFASADFQDSAWKVVGASVFILDSLKEQDWKNIGWFRTRFRTDSAAYTQLVGLDLGHRGASEIYVDGTLLGNFGTPAATRANEQTMRPFGDHALLYFMLRPTPNDVHTIAVRYSDTWTWERYRRWIASRNVVGFNMDFATARLLKENFRSQDSWYTFMLLIVGGMAALCFLHINLLIFTRWRAHLLYSLFTGSIAWHFAVRVAEKWFEYHVELLTWLLFFNQYILIFGFIACLGFFYAMFSTKRPIGIWLVGFSPIPLFWGSAVIPFLQTGNRAFLLFMAIIFADIMRIVIRAILRKQAGAWLLGFGGFCFAMCLGLAILAENTYITLPFNGSILVVISFFSIPLAMSIFMSRKIAATNNELAGKLVEVQTLTDVAITREVERKVLQADNDRKTQELEDARKLQLSMLPQTMPSVQGLDIAMFMQTATEVGGDYYDYFIAPGGMLTIAIGDATGHGVKAGTMVAATKSLLAVIAQDETISGSANVLKPSSPILKRMNLRSMFMALAVARIKPSLQGMRVLLSNAGMPSALVFRAQENRIEEVLLKSMPLGTMANFPYEDREIELLRGDALILMSDGFPERFNAQDEVLGYDIAKEACASVAGMSAQEIITHCIQHAETWASGAPLNDDMTFVVVRVV